jgi:hypothetical protein
MNKKLMAFSQLLNCYTRLLNDNQTNLLKGENNMKLKTKLLLLATFFVLALPLILTSTASAKYQRDGAVQDGVTGGWVTPNDMVCIVGVHQDGTLDIADGVTSARDCIYLQTGTMNGGTPFDLTGIATSAACTDTDGVGSDGAKHSWATTWCSKSLTGLDRTQAMCEGIGGTWVTTGKCVAYGRDFKGQDANGEPLAIGTKGSDSSDPASGKGFCYTSMMKTGIAAGSCPSLDSNSSTAFGYSVVGGNCVYAYGIAGDRTSALTKVDGTSNGPTLNMASYTTQGDCIANGGSWTNWIPAATTATAPGGTATIMTFDLTRQAVNADEGCLHCHSTKTEYNGPAERFKDSYLKTGHKNMLRKVTAGKNWAGPDEEVYSAYAAGTLDFGAATAQVSGVDKPLLFIFGDWMATAPAGLDVVVNMSGAAKYNGTSDYSCAACHTTGWSNTDSTKGLCNYSSKTTQVTCEAVTSGAFGAGVWYPLGGVQRIGTPAYNMAEPGDSFPGITFGTAGTWDIEGITCGRCHNATVPSVTRTQISGGSCAHNSTSCVAAGGTWTTSCNFSVAELYTTQAACTAASATWTASGTASAFPATASTGGGMGALAAGVLRNSLCFGCHQSMAKTSNGTGADADLANPTNLIVKNSITTGSCSVAGKTSESTCQSSSGIWTPTSYVPMFSGHVLGNSFLNSPHARYTGTVVANSLGKYDLASNTAANYNSKFKGFTCWQTPTSTSPAKTKADGTEIKTKTECETLYGAGAWRMDTGTPGDVNSIQGTCTTCHDVHQSLFVEGQEGLRKECENCHENSDYAAAVTDTPQIDTAVIAHPTSADTPFDTSQHSNSCEVCHMPKPTSGDFPMHVWRINPDASYSTFPTAAEYGAGVTPAKKIANAAADGSYSNAVWVDLDLACGQCHGSAGPAVHQFSKTALSTFAEVMHDGGGAPSTDCATCHTKKITTMNHPVSSGTPSTCITCHTKPGTSISIDASCGACHGGSAGPSATTTL